MNEEETSYTELKQSREPFYKTDLVTIYGVQFLNNAAEDPAETDNLAEKRPGKVKDLEQRFQEWKSEHDASFERDGAGRPEDY